MSSVELYNDSFIQESSPAPPLPTLLFRLGKINTERKKLRARKAAAGGGCNSEQGGLSAVPEGGRESGCVAMWRAQGWSTVQVLTGTILC